MQTKKSILDLSRIAPLVLLPTLGACDLEPSPSSGSGREYASREAPSHTPVLTVSRSVMEAVSEWSRGEGDEGSTLSEHLRAHADDLKWRNSDEGCYGNDCIESLTDMADVVESSSSICSVLLTVSPPDTSHTLLNEADTEGDFHTTEEFRQLIESAEDPPKNLGHNGANVSGHGLSFKSEMRGYTTGGFAHYIKKDNQKGNIGQDVSAQVVMNTVCDTTDPSANTYRVKYRLLSDTLSSLRTRTRADSNFVGSAHSEAQGYLVNVTSVRGLDEDKATGIVKKALRLGHTADGSINWSLAYDLVKLAGELGLAALFPEAEGADAAAAGAAGDAAVQKQVREDAENALKHLENGIVTSAGFHGPDLQQMKARILHGNENDKIVPVGAGQEVTQDVRFGMETHAKAIWPGIASAEVNMANDALLAGIVEFVDESGKTISCVEPGGFFIVSSEVFDDEVRGRRPGQLRNLVNTHFAAPLWPATGDLRTSLDAAMNELSGKDSSQGFSMFWKYDASSSPD